MDKTLVKLAKSFSNGLMEQIYFMNHMKDSEVIQNYLEMKVIPNDLGIAELGGENNATISN